MGGTSGAKSASGTPSSLPALTSAYRSRTSSIFSNISGSTICFPFGEGDGDGEAIAMRVLTGSKGRQAARGATRRRRTTSETSGSSATDDGGVVRVQEYRRWCVRASLLVPVCAPAAASPLPRPPSSWLLVAARSVGCAWATARSLGSAVSSQRRDEWMQRRATGTNDTTTTGGTKRHAAKPLGRHARTTIRERTPLRVAHRRVR